MTSVALVNANPVTYGDGNPIETSELEGIFLTGMKMVKPSSAPLPTSPGNTVYGINRIETAARTLNISALPRSTDG
jgi:hypothetical protein